MYFRFLLILALVSYSFGSFGQCESSKIMLRKPLPGAKYEKFKYDEKSVAIFQYTDTIFPNSEILRFKNLEYLYMSYSGKHLIAGSEDYYDHGIQLLHIDSMALGQLPQLKYLEIVGFDMSNTSIIPIISCKNLLGLTMNYCNLNDSHLAQINPSNLEHLDLSYNKMESISWYTKELFPSLCNLSIQSNFITTLRGSDLSRIPQLVLGDNNLGQVRLISGDYFWPSCGSNRAVFENSIEELALLLKSNKTKAIYVSIDKMESLALLKSIYRSKLRFYLGTRKLRIRSDKEEEMALFNQRIKLMYVLSH